jgi:GNAT superfamily N-acetyltransferase
MEIAEVKLIESMTDRAWPPAYRRRMGGWVLRQSGVGPNRRPNSALPPLDSELSQEQIVMDLREARRFYRRHDSQRLNIQIVNGSGKEIIAELNRLHYRVHDPSEVMTGDLISAVSAAESSGRDVTSVRLVPPEAWLSEWAAVSGSGREEIIELESSLCRIQEPRAYAVLYTAGGLTGVGRAVRTERWVGFFNIFVAPSARGRGFARLILLRLAAWGIEVGADTGYLQVNADNVPAISMYNRVGFGLSYRYHYLTGPI